MPIDALLVDGKRYLYFYCYDTATKQKKRVYIGPASDADSRKKALMLEGRHRSVQTIKKRILAHLSKLALYHALGDSAAETERLAIAQELENMAWWSASDQAGLESRSPLAISTQRSSADGPASDAALPQVRNAIRR
jgi:hypothetical protein